MADKKSRNQNNGRKKPINKRKDELDKNNLKESPVKIEEDKKDFMDENLEATRKKLIVEKDRLAEEKKEVSKKIEELSEKKKELAERERAIEEREINAEFDFSKQNEESLGKLRKEKDRLNQQIDNAIEKIVQLDQEYMDKKAEKMRKVDKEIEQYRKEKEGEIERWYKEREADLEKQQKDLKEKYKKIFSLREKELKLQEKEIDNKEARLDDQLESIQTIKLNFQKQQTKCMDYYQQLSNDVNQKKQELESRYNKLSIEQKVFEDEKNDYRDFVESKVEERIEAVQLKLTSKENMIKDLNKNIEELENDLYELKRLEHRAGQRTNEELLEQLELLQVEMKRLKDERANISPQEIIELRSKAENFEKLEEEINMLSKENAKLRTEKHNWKMSAGELQQLEETKDMYKKEIEVMKSRVAKYAEDVKKYKSLFEQPDEIEGRVGDIKEPYIDIKSTGLAEEDELGWLNTIEEKCNESGFKFNRRLIHAFHTSLKTAEWSPLTILAGVSGTGKSQLPELYSRFGGFYFLSLPVQPDWDSPQSIFGFYNSIDGRFNASPLLRTLYQSQDKGSNNSLRDNMVLILLDEMNLAHVELYFSEMLSKLERRRGSEEPIFLDVDLGSGAGHYPLELSRNVLWVGTMNEDETTKSLSDKVLDRGNLISFPRPDKFERRIKTKRAGASPKLAKSTWNQWLKNRVNLGNEISEYKNTLEAINSSLEEVGRALGHRVWQSVENYMSNHPMFIKAHESGNADDLNKYLQISFEDALVHKVMPKLRGIETVGKSGECLKEVQAQLLNNAAGLIDDFELSLKSPYRIFVWKSAKYLEANDE